MTIVLGVLGVVITILWQLYRKRKDRLDFLKFRWAEQQQINLSLLHNPESVDIFERMVYGSDFKTTKENNKRMFLVFLHLNQILHLYLAMQKKLIPEDEFDRMAKITLRLFVREKELVTYALENRGYGDNFNEKIKSVYAGLEPYNKIDWDKFPIGGPRSETKQGSGAQKGCLKSQKPSGRF